MGGIIWGKINQVWEISWGFTKCKYHFESLKVKYLLEIGKGLLELRL